MVYIRLNPQYALRHGRHCSYIVKRSGTYDISISPGTNAFSIVPKYIGYLISVLCRKSYHESIRELSEDLNITEQALSTFIQQLIENESPLCYEGNNTKIEFPKRLLVKHLKVEPISAQEDSIEYLPPSSMTDLCIYKPERPPFPLNINLMVTNKCSTECAYCYANRSLKEELTTKDIISIIHEAQRGGTVNLTLTGGDLLMRKDSLDIFSACLEAKFDLFLSTKTPKSPQYVLALKHLGIEEIQFSLDSVNPRTLEYLLGTPYSYIENVGRFFSACQKEGIRLSIRSVLTKINATVDEMKSLCSFISQYDNVDKWTLTPAFYSEYKTENHLIQPDNNQLVAVHSYTRNLTSSFPIFYNKIDKQGYAYRQYSDVDSYLKLGSTCLANTTSMSILCDGTCTICEMLYENSIFRLGNIKDLPLANIWNSEKALSLYRGNIVPKSKSPCASCAVRYACKGEIFKHICYVDVVKVHGHNNGDWPDPKCPKCKKVDVIL